MPSEARQKKIREKLNRAQKCSILGPQNLGSGGGPGPRGPPLDPHLCWDATPRPGPPGPGPPTRYPPRRRACWEIRSTSGRYASYWNAILFPPLLLTVTHSGVSLLTGCLFGSVLPLQLENCPDVSLSFSSMLGCLQTGFSCKRAGYNLTQQ